jgi:hypothetical protein
VNAFNVVRAAIPQAQEELVNYILWERTPFPVGSVSARDLYRAANRWERARKNGLTLCPFCNNKMEPEKFHCVSCQKHFDEIEQLRLQEEREMETQETELEDSGKFHRPDDIVQLVDTERWPFP